MPATPARTDHDSIDPLERTREPLLTRIDIGLALRMARNADPAAILAILAAAAGDLGATDIVLYLVDFGQTVLEPLPGFHAHAEVPVAEEVATTMAGRAFAQPAARDRCP